MPSPGRNCTASSPNCPTDSSGTVPHACQGLVFHQRCSQALFSLKTNRLSHTQSVSFPLAYDPAPYRNRPVLAPGPGNGTRSIEQLVRPWPTAARCNGSGGSTTGHSSGSCTTRTPGSRRTTPCQQSTWAANPPVVQAISVDRRTEFRGRTLYRGWNYVVMR